MASDNWREALGPLLRDLVCPACQEQNSPNDRTNKIHLVDSYGNVACNGCGHGGPIQTFRRRTTR